MRSEPRTKVIITAQDLQYARGKEAPTQLSQFEIAIRGKWGWFDDNRVASEQRRRDLSASKVNWEVPGYNADRHTKGRIANDHLFFIVLLNDFLRQLNLRELT